MKMIMRTNMEGVSKLGYSIGFSDNRYASYPRTVSLTSSLESGLAISNRMRWSEMHENKYKNTVRSRSWTFGWRDNSRI